MTDIGPSLSKLRRDWKDGCAEIPDGMIARRVVYGVLSRLPVGERISIERIGERKLRIVRDISPTPVERM